MMEAATLQVMVTLPIGPKSCLLLITSGANLGASGLLRSNGEPRDMSSRQVALLEGRGRVRPKKDSRMCWINAQSEKSIS